ncbi:hypothetical protein EJB05_21115 [Eragrostis curvula]|uniref:Major facilitator superfamily (MFS) profile domain-containing protein n=1 Tax=Eragrostis curvula TaxID=38414 RepID=A0A5J9V0V6_9POAL|nr:hypothetical protein EJB05_21115 [Eragrostis curvula]
MEGGKEVDGRVGWAAQPLDVEKNGSSDNGGARTPATMGIVRLFLACMVSGGIQYGWALQLSLLSPYSQTLGISHSLVSLTWICGPIAGFVVQPIVGYYSDRCTAKMGRRRPFILAGCIIICLSVMVIGFSADIGSRLGDTKENCSVYNGKRQSAAYVYILGFWFLDFANNTVQGPARAMMADLSAGAQLGPNVGQAIFSIWMALGSVLGYLSGANAKWHVWFPFLKTAACCDACANLKGAFFTAVVLIIISMTVTLCVANEEQYTKDDLDKTEGGVLSAFADLFKSLKNLPPSMYKVLAVTAVTWLSWFPFFQYNTDWMAREIFHGEPQASLAKEDAYNAGVREGAIGLLFCSVALGVASFLIPKLCRKLTSRVVWSISNLMVGGLLFAMVAIGLVSTKGYNNTLTAGLYGPDKTLKGVALAMFALIGIPQAVLFSVPWAVASEVATEEGGGQGLTIGVLNIAIVVPQLVIALTAGPIDGAFNKGNTPAFGIGGVFALICAVMAVTLLPKTRGVSGTAVMTGGH